MDDKLAPEGGQPEGATETPESQPAPEGEGTDQQQQPDPFANIPYEQARERYADQFADEAGQREQLGFSRGQGEARKEVAAIRKQVEGDVADRIAFERLEKMRSSDDPEAADNFRREMADPNVSAIYQRGQAAASRPAPEVTERLRYEAADGFLTKLDTHLNDRKELQGLSDDEKASLAKEKHPSLAALVDAKIDLSIRRGIAAGSGKVIKEKEDAARDKLRDEYRELGIEGPEEIEGGTVSADSKAKLQQRYADGDIETDEYTKRMNAIGAKP